MAGRRLHLQNFIVNDTPITNLEELERGQYYIITTNSGLQKKYIGTFTRTETIETDPDNPHYRRNPNDVGYTFKSAQLLDGGTTELVPQRDIEIYQSSVPRDYMINHAEMGHVPRSQLPYVSQAAYDPHPTYNYQYKPDSQAYGGKRRRVSRRKNKKQKRTKRRKHRARF